MKSDLEIYEMMLFLLTALRHVAEKDGPGLDMSPGGPCYDIAKRALDHYDKWYRGT